MTIKTLTIAALSSVIALSAACSKAEAPAKEAEAAPVPVEAPAAVAADTSAAPQMSDADNALLATLSPEEVSLVLLSCINPVNTAKSAKNLFDADIQAQLEATPTISQTKVMTRPGVSGMTLAQARQARDASPSFQPGGPAPTAEQVQGLKQCLVLTNHFKAEIADAS